MSIGAGEIKIAVNIQNQERISQLTKDIAKQEEEILKLNTAYQAGTVSQQQFLQQAAPFAAKIGAATKEIQALKGAMNSGVGAWGQSLQMVGQAVDDVQYGFRAIVNNIPQIGSSLAQSLGASTAQAMALGGAMGIVAVGINQIAQHWGEWFGEAEKLPQLTQDVEQLGRALKDIDSQIENLTKQQEGANQESNAGNLWGLMKPGFNKADAEKLAKLKELQAEAKKRIKEEKDLEATGPEHTKEAREVGGKVKEAIAGMAGGSDTLIGMLTARGMSYEEAREAVSQASRGHSGYLNDILGKLTPEEKRRGQFSGLAHATPEAIKRDREIKQAIKEGDEQERFTEKQFADEKAAARKRQRLDEMHEQWTAQDKIEALRNFRQNLVENAPKKPFRGDYFEYATSHGESYAEKQQIQKLKDIDTKIKDAVSELKALNRKNQEARAG